MSPPAGSPLRVIRGGAFGNAAALARSANRNNGAPGSAYDFLGLRPARGVMAGDFATSPLPPSGR